MAVVKITFYQIWLLCQLYLFLNGRYLAMVGPALVTSRLDYCSVFLCGAALGNGFETTTGSEHNYKIPYYKSHKAYIVLVLQ